MSVASSFVGHPMQPRRVRKGGPGIRLRQSLSPPCALCRPDRFAGAEMLDRVRTAERMPQRLGITSAAFAHPTS